MENKQKNLLIIFTRNPELGKCKTRLAATIGDYKALEVYKFLLKHTVQITSTLEVHKRVYFTENIQQNDPWPVDIYEKKLQKGIDLGEKMKNAFESGFKDGFKNVIIIGSDIYDLNVEDLKSAFLALESNEYVIGPAIDGGYYLLGMKSLNSDIFSDKNWGTSSVLNTTLADLKNNQVKLLEERNDVDVYEDICNIEVFQKFLN